MYGPGSLAVVPGRVVAQPDRERRQHQEQPDAAQALGAAERFGPVPVEN